MARRWKKGAGGGEESIFAGGWAWAVGSSHKDRPSKGLRRRTYSCLGFISCSACSLPVRPQASKAGCLVQLDQPCLKCGARLVAQECGAQSKQVVKEEGQGEEDDFVQFIHIGHHSHPLPPRGKPAPSEVAKVTSMILANPKLPPLPLRTGAHVGNPAHPQYRPSAISIFPGFSNLDRLSSLRKTVLAAHSSSSLPSLSSGPLTSAILSELDDLCPNFLGEHKDRHGEVVFLQTPFMKKMLASRAGVANREVNACVTDSAHKYFEGKGKLFMTSVFDTEMGGWMPVAFAYSSNETAENYEFYFTQLLNSLASLLSSIDDIRHQFFQVVDFSVAQEKGLRQAWTQFRFKRWRTALTDPPSPDVEALMRQEFWQEAQSLRKGCSVHFHRGALRVASNAKFVGEGGDLFLAMVTEMRKAATLEEFVAKRVAVEKAFPYTGGWLSWWCEDRRASMLMEHWEPKEGGAEDDESPASRRDFPRPSTTNAAEAMNWFTYRGTNKGQLERFSIAAGIAALFDLARATEEVYDAALREF